MLPHKPPPTRTRRRAPAGDGLIVKRCRPALRPRTFPDSVNLARFVVSTRLPSRETVPLLIPAGALTEMRALKFRLTQPVLRTPRTAICAFAGTAGGGGGSGGGR